jgi:hypothetical protein
MKKSPLRDVDIPVPQSPNIVVDTDQSMSRLGKAAERLMGILKKPIDGDQENIGDNAVGLATHNSQEDCLVQMINLEQEFCRGNSPEILLELIDCSILAQRWDVAEKYLNCALLQGVAAWGQSIALYLEQ